MPVSHSGFAVCATVHNPAYVIPSRAAAKCCRVKKSQDGLLCDFFFLFTGRIKNICDGRLFTNPRVGGCNCPLSSIIYSYTSVTGLKRLQKGRLIGWNLKMQSEPFDLCSKQKRLCTSQTETGKFIQCFLEHDVQCWYGLADYIFSQLRWLKALFMRITAYASQHQPRKLSTSFFFFFPIPLSFTYALRFVSLLLFSNLSGTPLFEFSLFFSFPAIRERRISLHGP